MDSLQNSPWLAVVVLGPLALLILFIWARVRTGRRNDDLDPDTPSDDPSKGMPGHD
jgi:hypothetical protein